MTTVVVPAVAAASDRCPCTDDPPFRDRPSEAVVERMRSLPVGDLIRQMREGSCSVAIEAAALLADERDFVAVAPLIEVLQGSDCKVRVAAAAALQAFRNDEARAALLEALRTGDRRIRAAAAASLGHQHDDRSAVTRSLIPLLSDPSKHVRQAVAESLGRLGNPESEEALVRALQDSSKHVRQAAAEALGTLRRH